MDILTGIVVGVSAGVILTGIGWIKEHLDHRRLRGMEIRYVRDALNEYLEQRKAASLEADNIYNGPAKNIRWKGMSKKDIEVDLRFVRFRDLYNKGLSNANRQSTFTPLERWQIENALLKIEHLFGHMASKAPPLLLACQSDFDLEVVKIVNESVNKMPRTKGKALRLEKKKRDANQNTE